MTYKFEYEDENHQKHVRYYNALNVETAKRMLGSDLEQVQGDSGKRTENINILDVLKKDHNHWEHISIP